MPGFPYMRFYRCAMSLNASTAIVLTVRDGRIRVL
jgi:hypothetical protein